MNVTMLIAEYLIIGFQVLLFLTLILLKIEHVPLKLFFESLNNSIFNNQFNVLMGAAILGFTYLLGMLMDTIWYRVTHKWRKGLVKKDLKFYFTNRIEQEKTKEEDEINQTRKFTTDDFYSVENKIYGQDGLRERIYRRRGRIRIFGSSLFHIPLIVFSLSLNVFEWWIIVLGIILEIFLFYAFMIVNKEYIKMIVFYKT